MKNQLRINIKQQVDWIEFLENLEYEVKEVSSKVGEEKSQVYCISKVDEVDIFIYLDEKNIFFEIDLGDVTHLDNKDFYYQLLDLNTQILPVSLGLDTNSVEANRLILIESREIENFDSNEFLTVLESLQLASLKVQVILEENLKKIIDK